MRYKKGEGWVSKICPVCEKTFPAPRCSIKANTFNYCSRSCGTQSRYTDCTFASRQELVHLYCDEGLTMVAIAKKLNVSSAGIAYQLDKAGIKRRKNGANLRQPDTIKKANLLHLRGSAHHSFHDIPITKIRDAYNSGVSTLALGEQYNVSAATIQCKLRQSGVFLRSPGFQVRHNNVPAIEIKTAYMIGNSTQSLAGQFNLSRTTIKKYLRKESVNLRHPGFGLWLSCEDGHIAQSNWERIIDNWLTAHDIPHECHPILPLTTRKKADFLAKSHYIEIWGITGNAQYSQNRREKVAFYKKHNLPLIQIWPSNITRNDYRPLECLLQVP